MSDKQNILQVVFRKTYQNIMWFRKIEEILGSRKYISYFCPENQAPVVQWIEYRIPVPTIRVRFPSGVQSKC